LRLDVFTSPPCSTSAEAFLPALRNRRPKHVATAKMVKMIIGKAMHKIICTSIGVLADGSVLSVDIVTEV
jgi:hypothetical protein